MTPNYEIDGVLDQFKTQERAEIERSAVESPFNMQKIVLDLSVDRTWAPYEIKAPFKSIVMIDASDPAATCGVAIHRADVNSLLQALPLKLRDIMSFPQKISKAFITHAAQAGKTCTLYLFLDGDFQSGTTNTVNAGGVSINDGASFARAIVNLAAATPTQIFAANLNRKAGTFCNDSGADMWIGEAGVTNAGATKGLLVAPGEKVTWRNTAALFGYSVAGWASLVTISET